MFLFAPTALGYSRKNVALAAVTLFLVTIFGRFATHLIIKNPVISTSIQQFIYILWIAFGLIIYFLVFNNKWLPIFSKELTPELYKKQQAFLLFWTLVVVFGSSNLAKWLIEGVYR